VNAQNRKDALAEALLAVHLPRKIPDNLATLLEDLEAFMREFVIVTDTQAVAVTLWVAHTYVFEAARATPYLNFWSPEVGSGKTTALEVLEVTARDSILADDLTGAVLFRLVHARKPTLLIDEVDGVFNKKNNDGTEDIRKVLNSGYKAGKKVFRCGPPPARELEEYEVFCPKAMAGLGTLPGTLAHRSIPIGMMPPLPGVEPRDFDSEEVAPAALALRARCEAWGETVQETLRDPELRPAKLPQLDGRRNEIWRILFRIADLAGNRWPQAARAAALELCGGQSRDDEASMGVRLLSDIRRVFIEERMSCSSLAATLNTLEESPWGGWNDGNGIRTRELGKKLGPYGIRAKSIRIEGERAGNGYEREQFEDAWGHYLAIPDEQTGTTGTSGSQTQKDAFDEPVHEALVPVEGNGASPHEKRDVPVVPVSSPGLSEERLEDDGLCVIPGCGQPLAEGDLLRCADCKARGR
jgi:Protein of unknown function (DUF3631)